LGFALLPKASAAGVVATAIHIGSKNHPDRDHTVL